MSKLIAFGSNYEVMEYFPNAYKSSYDKGWDLKAEEEYPFLCHAHADTSDKRLLKDIRLYIEKYGKDDVFYSKVDKSYSYCYNLDKAKYYLDIEEYSSAWIYADLAINIEKTSEEASVVKKRAEEGLKNSSALVDNSKYIETLKYKRTVYGGGGVMPDIFVPLDTLSYTDYYKELVSKGVINSYVLDRIDKNRNSLL